MFELVKELFEKYEGKMGSINCSSLRARHCNDEIGCRDIILEAAKILDNIMSEND